MKQIIGVFLILITLGTCSLERKRETENRETILKEPKVDKRVELLSIVFRLANSHEYSQNLFPQYIESIENHFGEFRSHELIKYVKDEL